MNKENIVDVDVTEEELAELMQSETVDLGGRNPTLDELISDIQHAHKELDEYKSGSLSLSQTLSEAAKNTDDATLKAVLSDMSDGAFFVYLRLNRGDLELLGGRDGKFSDFLTE